MSPKTGVDTLSKMRHIRHQSMMIFTIVGPEMDGSTAVSPLRKGKTSEDKREKFISLAQNRTVNAIRAIRVIGKLANKSAYQYDDNDVKKIIGALIKEIDTLKSRMTSKSGKSEIEFLLD